MQVSAIGSSPNFSSNITDDNIETLANIASRYSDYQDYEDGDTLEISSSKQPVIKSPIESAIALVCAAALPFAIGKGTSKAAIELANSNKYISKYASKFAGFVAGNASKLGQALKGNGSEILNSEASNKFMKKSVELISKAASGISSKVSKIDNPTTAASTAIGVAAMIKNTPEILKADTNGNGVKDVLEKNVSAYRQTQSSLGALGEVLTTVGNIVA